MTQNSRILGVNGPRWLLRATLLGAPARDLDGSAEWEDVLTRVAVRRGAEAMPVGEPLPLVLPDQARRVGPASRLPVDGSTAPAPTPSTEG